MPDGCDQVAIIAGVAAHGMTTPGGNYSRQLLWARRAHSIIGFFQGASSVADPYRSSARAKSLRLDAGFAHYVTPFLGFLDHEPLEVRRRND
jgi:hypothetical protein